MSEFHLAQINVARMLAPLDEPLMADFVAQLPPINALAEQSPGFVWRLQSEYGDATSFKVYGDELIIVNMTVWESLETLREYVYNSAHSGAMRDRRRWFEKFEGPYYALWWIRAAQLPTIEQAMARLKYLQKHGETAYAFSFRQVFPKPVKAKER